MTPYYDADGITLYCCDCRDFSKDSAVQKCGMILADPPYGETSLEWDRWPLGWVGCAQRILTSNGSIWCFGSMRMFLERIHEFAGLDFTQEIVWEKHNGSGFHVDRFRRVHEFAFHFKRSETAWADVYKKTQYTFDARKRVVRKKEKPAQWHGKTGSTTYISEDGGPRLMRSVLQIRSEHGRAVHPTQKPLAILTPLIEYSCPPDGTVFVPFSGSGSELLAARLAGRRAIGCEINPEYCQAAVDRLRQGELFSKRSGAIAS